MLRQAARRLRYALDELLAREVAGQFVVFLGLVAVLALLGTTAVFFGLFSPDNATVSSIPRGVDEGAIDALWWSLQLLLNLPGLEATYGATWPVVVYALILSLSSLAVFAILISLVRTVMARRLEALRRGDTPVSERDHVVFLYWTAKTIPALRQIARLRPGSRVALLAPREVRRMQESLRVAGVNSLPVKVILRTGRPSNASELARIAVDWASSVVIFSPDSSDGGARSDNEVIKTMMLLAGKSDWARARPTLLAEIDTGYNLELARLAGRGEVQIVASSAVTSKVVAQCIRNPGVSAVYRELLDREANNIYVETRSELAGMTIQEAAQRMPDAVPIGVTWREGDGDTGRIAAALNPEPSYEIDEHDALIVVARAERTALRSAAGMAEPTDRSLGSGQTANTPESVLIVGWSGVVHDIIMELDAHASRGTEITVLSALEPDQAEQRLHKFVGQPLHNVSVVFRCGDTVERSSYEDLDLSDIASMVVLADADVDVDETDAHTLRVLLRLFDMLREAGASPRTVVELKDDVNRPLFDALNVGDLVASADIVSGELAQIARQPVLGAVYTELMRAGGMEISLRPVRDYLPGQNECTFGDLVAAGHANLETVLGIVTGGDTLLNPDRQGVWTVDESKIIVLAQQVYA